MTAAGLWTDLARVDALVRAHTVRWRATVGASKPARYWGMVLVTDDEIDGFLRAPFTPPGHLSAELREQMAPLRDQAERVGVHPGSSLSVLRERFGLTDLERDILALCLLPELDDRYRRLFAYLQDDASRRLPTVELLLQILQGGEPDPGAGRSAFAAGGTLRSRRIVRLDDGGPLTLRQVRIDDRVIEFLLGSALADVAAADWLTVAAPLAWDDLVLTDARRARLTALADWWDGGTVSFLLHGPPGSGRRSAARAFCTHNGTPLLLADVPRLVAAGTGWAEAIDVVRREATLRSAAVLWHAMTPAQADEWHPLWATPGAGLTFVSGSDAWDPAGGPLHVRLDFPVPGFDLRRRLWQRRMPALTETAAAALANDFQFTGGQIVDAIATARGHAVQRDPAGEVTLDDLYEGCRRRAGRRIISFARRVEPRPGITFDSLVLPPPNRRQLDELRARIRNRGRVTRHLDLGKGLVALFTGPSGTGKTMAATLLAQEQGVELYKVDLSAVVSKWVGETEKNMHRLFADAEDANAILFFDEAEALFGRRGEVKDAQDRWANLETNYLLQRVEEYHGVVILTSNLRQNLDPAFLRRIGITAEFPQPPAAARARIWELSFPPGLPHPGPDVIEDVATRFQLSGGNIHNAVVDAVYRAVDANPEHPSVTARQVIAGIAREYQKLGKPLTRSEFGERYYAWLTVDILGETEAG
ncbi:AAA family ATPase [Actinoplanes sp. NPDC051861]|uniref:AAA family ATPase n=1 Tax=Actinoplanes sp. NPDC051861 TaxID=3155170 RepID=UPI0034344C28